MRRGSATLLILLFSLSLIGPAVVARTDSQLPECCRRDGKHRCSLGQTSGQPSGFEFRSIPERCPFFPAVPVVSPHGKTSLARNHGINSASLVSQLVRQVRTESFYRVSFCRSKQERRPPTLPS
jgi:hypothetical protein